jgi:hypothetical protein
MGWANTITQYGRKCINYKNSIFTAGRRKKNN